jgi:hypothetical protein
VGEYNYLANHRSKHKTVGVKNYFTETSQDRETREERREQIENETNKIQRIKIRKVLDT